MIRHHSTWITWIGLFTFISLEAVFASTAVAPDVRGSSTQREAVRGRRQGFELNQGQVGPEFTFVTRGDGYELHLGPTEAVLWLPQTDISGKGDRRDGQERTPDVIRISYLGAQLPSVVGMERLPGKVNYLVGRDSQRWRTNIPTFAAVGYEGLYPGVNLVVRGDLRALEFTFIIAPGANPDAIRLESEGAGLLETDQASGGMILRTAGSEVRAARPRAYQEAGDAVQDVAVEYGAGSDRQFGFHLPAYDPERPLFLQLRLWRADSRPSADSQDAVRVAVDAQGNAYIAGRVPIGREGLGGAFVSKLSADGMSPVYTTYLGGDGEDVPAGIALDVSGEVLLAGWTSSTNFPTVGGVQPELAGSTDAFVSKLSADGSTLLFSTYLGGEGEDEARDIAVDAAGGAWVTGRTRGAGLPTTYGARQAEFGGMSDAFLGRLSPDGSTLLYASYLGGKGEDEGNAIGVDGLGSVHVAGTTRSADLPIEDALQPAPRDSTDAGAADVFVATLSADGGKLLHATYLGGSGDDAATSLDVDSFGNTYVAGRTASDDFPATGGAVQPVLGGEGARSLGDAFVAKLDAERGTLLYATPLGGVVDDEAMDIAVDARGNAWIAGTTSSTDFPLAGGAPGRFSGKRDAFVVEIAPAGDVLLQSTFIGGKDDDAGFGLAVSSHGVVVVGAARSIEMASAKPMMPAFSGGRVFVRHVSQSSVEAAGCPGTINFDNSAGSGLWQTATNWDLDRLPIATDDVCIGAGFSVTLSSGIQTVNSLLVSGTGSLALTAGTLNLATASQIDGSFALSGTGILGGAGDLTVNGATTWTGGTMTGAGTTNTNGGISFSGATVKDLTASRILNTAGTTTWAGTGGVRAGSGAVINNSGTWDCQSNSTISNVFGGTSAFNNSGTFKKSTLAGTTTVSIPFNNSLTVDVQTGTVTLNGGGTSSGTFTGSGVLQFSSGTHDLQAGSSVNVSAVTVSGGTVNLAGSLGGASLTISGGTINVNSVVAANPTALVFSGGTLGGTGTISISGLTTWTGGQMTGAGTTNTNGGISFSGSFVKDLTASRILNTAGTTTWTGVGPVRSGSGAVINNSGTWDCQSDTSISNAFGGTSAFNNSGTFRKSAGAGATAVSIPFNNSLTVDVQSGTINLGNGGTSSGTFTGSGTLQFGGGTHDLQSASSINVPTVVFSGGTTNLAGSHNATSATTVSGGTANFNPTGTVVSVGGSLTISSGVANFSSGEAIDTTTLSLSGGALSGTDTVTVSGLTTWTTGTMTGAGTTNANGGISMSGGNVKDLTSSRILSTAGTTTWTGAGGIRAGSGAVINNNGTWDCQSDSTISNAFGGSSAFNNSGTFKKSAGAGPTAVSIPFNNSLTVDVQSGTLNLGGGGTSSGTFTGSGALQFSSGTHDLQAASSINLSAVVVSAGTVNLAGSLSGASLAISGGATVNVSSVGAVNATALVFSSGTLGGTGTISISGLTTWTSGVMTGAGTTNANGGISISGTSTKNVTSSRILNTAGTTTWTGTGGIQTGAGAVINNNGTWDCQSDSSITIVGGTFNNGASGIFKKSAGAGTTTVSIPFNSAGSVQGFAGTLNFTAGYVQTAGSTTLNGGAIQSTTTMDIQGGSFSGVGTVAASITSAGQVAPGLSPGSLGISGNYTQSSPGSFNVEIGGVTPGAQYDQLTVTGAGAATLAGTLDVSLVDGFTPADGDSFTIVTAVSRSGTFGVVNLPPLPIDRGWRLTYGSSSVVLEVVTDTDGDGTNDVFDCAPLDPGAFAIPGEVTGDAFASDTYSWNSAVPSSGSATVHDVVRGALNQFPVGSGVAETCVGSDLPGSSVADGTSPSSRSGFYYLARGRNVCGTGTYGLATSGAARTSAICP